MATFLESSGYLDLGPGSGTRNVNGVFGRGNAISNYRSPTTYYTAGGSGTFPLNDIVLPDTFWGTGPDPAYSADYNGLFANTTDGFDLSKPMGLTCNFNNNGTVTTDLSGTAGGSWISIEAQAQRNWHIPNAAGIGNSHYIRYVPGTLYINETAGDMDVYNGITTSWQLLNQVRYFNIQARTNRTTRFAEIDMDIQISPDASTVIYTGNVRLVMGPDV